MQHDQEQNAQTKKEAMSTYKEDWEKTVLVWFVLGEVWPRALVCNGCHRRTDG